MPTQLSEHDIGQHSDGRCTHNNFFVDFVTFFVKRLNCCPRTFGDYFQCKFVIYWFCAHYVFRGCYRLIDWCKAIAWVSPHSKLHEEKTNHFTNNFISLAFLLIAPSCYCFFSPLLRIIRVRMRASDTIENKHFCIILRVK